MLEQKTFEYAANIIAHKNAITSNRPQEAAKAAQQYNELETHLFCLEDLLELSVNERTLLFLKYMNQVTADLNLKTKGKDNVS